MMAPTRRAARLLLALFPAALLPALAAPWLWSPWAVGLSLALTAMLADALLAPPAARLRLDAQAPGSLFVGEPGRLVLRLGSGGWPVRVPAEALADLDPRFEPQPALPVTLPLTGRAEVAFTLDARRRGTLGVEAAWLRWTGPLRLVQRVRRIALGREIAVVPDVRPVRDAALRFSSSRAGAGLKVERFVGEGSEFESLVDYIPGLDHRAIDWKASARRRRLVAREYRAERNHEVLLAFDTGRLMSEPLAGLARLDHAIHAGLLVAWVALATGDRVGLAAFDDRPRRFLAPRGGVRAFHGLQRESARLDYSQAETNFTLGLLELARRLTRRSLVVVLTDFVDTVTAELMVDHLGLLARRHLVLFVALSDASLAGWAGAPPHSFDALGRAVLARGLLHEREGVLRHLRRLGVHCVDAPPAALSTRLVNRYLELRRREMV